MRSPRSVKRPHTNHHTTNIRRNRGKQVKNSRMRHKQWAHTLIYSPDVAEKRQIFTLSLPVIKEVSDDERARRAEKKKEKKLVAKLNDDEARRLELERKEKEREERKQKREEERKRQEELEYQKWQEAQRKKEEELAKAEAERKAAEKKAAEERKKEAAQAAQAEAKKEKAKKEKKQSEGEKTPVHTAAKAEKVTPTEAPTAPAQKPVEEAEKKKKKKEKEPSIEKESPVKVANATPTETSPPPVEVHEEEKHTKKKGGKGKKASESESGHHNEQNEPTVTNEVHIDEPGHGKHEAHGKKGKKGKKAESESADVANGHVVNAVTAEATHVIDSAPVEDVPNGGLVQLDGEKKKGKGKKHGATSPEPSVVTHTKEVVEKVTTNEVSHTETNGHEEKHGHRSGEESSGKKNKHKEKKGKQISPETEITTKVTVVTEKYKSENDAPTATTDKASPPIQVHEVTSTAHENGTKETVHTITTTITTSATKSPTQFAQNVERLVSHTLNKAKHDIVEIDPNVKMTIDAQLIKLSEKKVETTNDHKIHITPLPLELHYSRPTTPSNRERVYKLLPRDIIFCSGLIDSHGEDYAAMAADKRNIYKENARAIQRKVRIFKESPHYQTYLRAKEEGRTVEEILAEEGQT